MDGGEKTSIKYGDKRGSIGRRGLEVFLRMEIPDDGKVGLQEKGTKKGGKM